MKNVKRIVALLLALVMAFCLVACHKKDEVAVSSGDFKITSAMYSYYLISADMEAKNYIDDNTDLYDTSAENFDYFKQTIDGKSYTDYVEELAINNCLKAIAYQKLCADNGLTLDAETIASAEYNAEDEWYGYSAYYYYGDYYGYQAFMPQNGVSFETFKEVYKINYYGDLYFNHVYGEGGEKEVADADIQKALDENYAAVYLLSKSYTSSDVDDVKAEMEKFKERLQNGEDFDTVYEDFYSTDDDTSSDDTSSDSTSSDSTSSDTASSEDNTSSDAASSEADESNTDTSSEDTSSNEESEDPKPKDSNIQIVGAEDTQYAFGKFEDVKAMAVDEVKLIEDSDSSVIYLAVKKDINSDSYYKDTLLASDILYLLKGDEFNEFIDTYIATLEYSVSNFAIGQFKVKKIYYGE